MEGQTEDLDKEVNGVAGQVALGPAIELDTPTNAAAMPQKSNAGPASQLRTLLKRSKAHLL
ncbi:MAG: hypothetical protein C5B50_03050 [Verrucomicrobia bacterium]|nr:MAG: hypothetical protein C5B50_03050 [Verrucomicrobiota bacterium]